MSLTPDFQVGLRLALRARFASISLWLLIALAVVALLAAQFSGRQPATVALDVGLSFIRISLPLVIVLMSQELLSREIERRYFLTSLTYPRPRHHFLLGRLLAIVVVVFSLLLVMGLLLGVTIWFIGHGYEQDTPVALGTPYLITISFLAVDLFVVSTMAILLAVFATTPSFILIGTFGFMIAARSYSIIIALLERERELVPQQELYQGSLSIFHYLLPDLSALDVRMIALYDTMSFLPESWPLQIFRSFAYALLLIGGALWILQRRHFS